MDQALAMSFAERLGFTAACVDQLRRMPFEGAQVRLDELKKEARKLYRKLVYQLHPDRNPDDPDAGTKLQVLSDVLKQIEGLKLQRAAPPPIMHVQFHPSMQVQRVHMHRYNGTTSGYSSTSTSTTVTYVATRVVNIKPV